VREARADMMPTTRRAPLGVNVTLTRQFYSLSVSGKHVTNETISTPGCKFVTHLTREVVV